MNKVGMMSAKDQKKGALVPRLRFPEFRDAGEWEELTVNDLLIESCQIGSKGNKAKKLTVKLWGKGVFEKEETFQGSVNTQYYRRRSGQFIYSRLDFLNQAFGIIPHHLDGFESTVDLPCFDFRSDVNPIFFLEFVKRETFYKKCGEIADGGRKAKRIQVDVFLSFPIVLPLQTKEQQRIADCLSSLNERIAAETSKLDMLKEHKKGLLKQLFPAEGETLPQLRCPEFRDAGEWGINLLGQISENLDNRRIPITENVRIRGAIPYYGASGIVDYVNDFIFDEYLLCVSEDGANLIARTSPIAFSISGKSWINNHAHVLKFYFPSRQKLVENYINFIKIDEFLTGMAQPKLNKAKLEVIPIPIPPTEKEEQKIVDCLSSLDQLISAQAQKIDLLKTHKKGLMQQLFPVLDEAKA